jgi:ABC-type multidrug transport system fused ATPase/permease subunit
LVLSNVQLEAGPKRLLSSASLRVPSGARVVLEGPPESGKTALLELVYGLRRQSTGAVLLDGIDTRELTRDVLRRRVAVVLGPELLKTSILENVRVGDHAIGSGRVRGVLDALQVLSELSHLPDGLDTVVGDGGLPLSYSQAFRITLARALVRSPGLLALDADFWSMDREAVRAMLAVVARDDAPWTLVVVGDSAALPGLCTHSVRLSQGQLSLEAAP